MHDHQRIGCSPVAKLLQKVVEDIAIVLHERLRFGDQVLEQPRPLKETNKLIDMSDMVKSAHGISDSHNTLE